MLEHNGDPFDMEQMSRVIYHGSTKAEDEEKLGKYGSGLLTTHLLSDTIHVSGKLVDGREFNYPLHREPTSVETIYDCMQSSAQRFNDSLESGETTDLPDGFTTRFRYPIEDESRDMVVRQGIESLKKMAPFVLAFNQEFSGISVEDHEEVCNFAVAAFGQKFNDGVHEIHEIIVTQTVANNAMGSRHFLVKKGDTALAVQVFWGGKLEILYAIRQNSTVVLGTSTNRHRGFQFPRCNKQLSVHDVR